MGFARRYGTFPPNQTITQIEGIVIVDSTPAGPSSGVGTGTVGIAAEFADVSSGVAVASGVVTTFPQPVEIFSAADMLNKVGGFDETLGDTGNSQGNGFITLRNKQFSRLIAVAINNASSQAARMVRQLPTNQSATVPVPIVPTSGGTVAAGTQFVSGANRVRSAAAKSFTAFGPYDQGVDGAVTATSGAATQIFSSAAANFLTNGVVVGDVLVLGVISGAGAQGANANTYRVQAITDANDIVVEMLDGSTFNWTTGTALAWRLQPGSDADTAGVDNHASVLATAGGFTVPARPLDQTITGGTTLTPSVAQAAGTASSWSPLSGLVMLTQTGGGGGLTFTANIQTPNEAANSTLDGLYTTAIGSFNSGSEPMADVNILIASRKSTTINSSLVNTASLKSATGLGTQAIIAPPLSVLTTSAALAATAPGVGAQRQEATVYNWPGGQTTVPEAVGFKMKGADGLFYVDGNLDQSADSWAASVESVLSPYINPAIETAPATTVLQQCNSIQRGVAPLQMNDYIAMKAGGIMGLRLDRTAGMVFQSGVTTSLVNGQKSISRRRMAWFIEDSCAEIVQPFQKQPLSQQNEDSAVTQLDEFLASLVSADNEAQQEINAYSIDDKSGNTLQNEALGIFVIIVKVQLLAEADFIVLQFSIGPGVEV